MVVFIEKEVEVDGQIPRDQILVLGQEFLENTVSATIPGENG